MALGGGIWTSQNKVLPGSYINFISKATAGTTIGERGVVAVGMKLDWGIDGSVQAITPDDFYKNSVKLFGYEFDADEMKWLREIFLNARKCYVYKLNSASTGKATCTYADAKYSGSCGNNLKIVVAVNADDEDLWDVTTLYNNVEVDSQTVASAAALVNNDYVDFKTSATLAATAGLALTGGTSAAVTAANHTTFLGLLEAYADINAVGLANDESAVGALTLNAVYAAWVERMRDQVGMKLQAVLYNYAADYEGVVNVVNAVDDTNAASLVYWVLGVVGGTAINASATNKRYDGEYDITVSYTQAQLEAFITAGKFAMHRVGDDIRVLMDIDSLTTTTADKGEIFKANQTIRVIDDMATRIAYTFNTKYLGKVPNDEDGRTALWADVVAYCDELERIRAIEDFDEETVTVEQGNEKRAVLVNAAITIVNAMEQLYMTTVIS